jgi:hypothetical protein
MELPLQEDWDALVSLLNEALKLLGGEQIEPSRQRLLEFSNTAAMLGLQDLADVSVRLQEFLVNTIKPEANDEAVGTLSFAISALIEKMQTQQHGAELLSGLGDVLLYLEFYSEDAASAPDMVESNESAGTLSDDMTLSVSGGADLGHVAEEDSAEAVSTAVGQPSTDTEGYEKTIPEEAGSEVSKTSEQSVGVTPDPLQAEAVQPEAPAIDSISEESAILDVIQALDSEEEDILPSFAEPPMTATDLAKPGPSGMDMVGLYRMMLDIDPSSRAFVLLAEELYSRSMWKEAADVCRKGLVYHPHHMRAKTLLGCALWGLGETDEADLVHLQVRGEIQKNAVVYKILSEIAKSRGDSNRSLALRQIYDSLVMEDAVTETSSPSSLDSLVETPPPTDPEESSAVKILSGLMARFAQKDQVGLKESQTKEQHGLFTTDDREALKAMMRGGR